MDITNTTIDDEVEILWELAATKKVGWQLSDNPVVRTSKPALLEAWKKIKKNTSIKQVELAIQAQARGRRNDRQAGHAPAQPKLFEAWLRAHRYAAEIIPVEKKVDGDHKLCQCGKPTLGPSIKSCSDCLVRTDESELHERRRKFMEPNGLLRKDGETAREWCQRCREHAVNQLGVKI